MINVSVKVVESCGMINVSVKVVESCRMINVSVKVVEKSKYFLFSNFVFFEYGVVYEIM
jgi:hypothetical protein